MKGHAAILTVMVLVFMASLPASRPALATGNNSITSPSSDTGRVGFGTSLALDVLGNPVVSYVGNSVLKVLHCDDSNCDGVGDSITSPDPAPGVGSNTSLVLDASGFPVISYSVAGLKVLHCYDPNCDGVDDIITSLDTGGSSSLALDAAGNPVIAYGVGYPDYDLRLLHCGNPNCTEDNITTSPDTDGNVGFGTSLALDAAVERATLQ